MWKMTLQNLTCPAASSTSNYKRISEIFNLQDPGM